MGLVSRVDPPCIAFGKKCYHTCSAGEGKQPLGREAPQWGAAEGRAYAFFVQCGCSVPEDAHSACNHPCLVHPRRDLCIISPFPYIPNFLIGGVVSVA